MKIAFYSPYLDTAGGGEKYILTAAEILSEKHEVFVLLDNHLNSIGIDQIKQKIKQFHNIDFSRINFMTAPIGKGSSFFARLFFLKTFDVLFYLTDGSIFYSTAKKNILHFQVPFPNTSTGSFWGKIKLSSWNMAIYNSDFTKGYVEKEWLIKGKVIYPPVSTNLFKPLQKKKQIISVGRFFGYLKDKKHEVLIDAFKSLVDENKLDEWSLHLVGGASEGDREYIDLLKQQAKGYKIFLHPNLPFEDLKKLYGESSIYWHASGYQESDPKKMEHFGITIVEAMAAGCVPVVVNLGGAKEIIKQGESGFLWNGVEGLKKFTLSLIKDSKLREEMMEKSEKRSKVFSKDKFSREIIKLVEGYR